LGFAGEKEGPAMSENNNKGKKSQWVQRGGLKENGTVIRQNQILSSGAQFGGETEGNNPERVPKLAKIFDPWTEKGKRHARKAFAPLGKTAEFEKGKNDDRTEEKTPTKGISE